MKLCMEKLIIIDGRFQKSENRKKKLTITNEFLFET